MSGVTCLLVEDHLETANAICDYLKVFFPAWEISRVATGKEALAKTAAEAPDAMILDIALADDVDGMEVVRRLAKSDLPKKPKIVIVTALGNRAFRGPKPGRAWVDQLQDYEKELVFAFFEKPFRWKEFLTALAQAVGAPIPASLEGFTEY